MNEYLVSNAINAPTQIIANELTRWKRNRDFIIGEYAVKGCESTYLPFANPTQPRQAYLAYRDNVVFYPAASRTADGLKGLVFRKAPVLEGSAALLAIANTITVDGDTIDDLAEQVWDEVTATNYAGLLVDVPAIDASFSRAQAIAAGQRPFVALYAAESILEVTTGVVLNRKVLTRVRLLEDDQTVRELVLVDGVYTQRVHSNASGVWAVTSEITPSRNGQTLDFIPFQVVNSDGKTNPTPAPLDHAVNLNLSHYRLSGFIATANYFLSAPIPYVCGVKTTNEKGEAMAPLMVAPGSLWVFEDHDTKVEYLEFEGAGMASLREERTAIEGYLATVGARILAQEKAAAEAAETLAIRRASENSVLGSAARTVGRQIQQALQYAADWMDGQTVNFALNQDFLPTPMSSLDLTALVGAWQAGAISYESLFYAMRDGEILSPALTLEEEQTRLEQAEAARPPVSDLG